MSASFNPDKHTSRFLRVRVDRQGEAWEIVLSGTWSRPSVLEWVKGEEGEQQGGWRVDQAKRLAGPAGAELDVAARLRAAFHGRRGFAAIQRLGNIVSVHEERGFSRYPCDLPADELLAELAPKARKTAGRRERLATGP